MLKLLKVLLLFLSLTIICSTGVTPCSQVPTSLANITQCIGNTCDVYSTVSAHTNLAVGAQTCFNFTTPFANNRSAVLTVDINRMYVYYPEIYNYQCYDYTTPCNWYSRCGVIQHTECTNGSPVWGTTDMRWHVKGEHTTVGCPITSWRPWCMKCWVQPGKNWKVIKLGSPSVKVEATFKFMGVIAMRTLDVNTPQSIDIGDASISVYLNQETFSQLANKHIIIGTNTKGSNKFVIESTRSINLPNQITSLTNLCSLQSNCGATPYCWSKRLLEQNTGFVALNTQNSQGKGFITGLQNVEASIPEMLTVEEFVPGLKDKAGSTATLISNDLLASTPGLDFSSLFVSDFASQRESNIKSMKLAKEKTCYPDGTCVGFDDVQSHMITKELCNGDASSMRIDSVTQKLMNTTTNYPLEGTCIKTNAEFMGITEVSQVQLKSGEVSTVTMSSVSGLLLDVTKAGLFDITVVSKMQVTFIQDKVCPKIVKVQHNKNQSIVEVTAYTTCDRGVAIVSSNDSSIIPSQLLELTKFTQIFKIPILRTYDTGVYNLQLCHKAVCDKMNFTFESTKVKFDTLEDRLADIVNWQLVDSDKYSGLERTLMEWINTVWIWCLIFTTIVLVYIIYSVIAYPLSLLFQYLYRKFGKGYISGTLSIIATILYYTSILTLIIYLVKLVIVKAAEYRATRIVKEVPQAPLLTSVETDYGLTKKFDDYDKENTLPSTNQTISSQPAMDLKTDVSSLLSTPRKRRLFYSMRGQPQYNNYTDTELAYMADGM